MIAMSHVGHSRLRSDPVAEHLCAIECAFIRAFLLREPAIFCDLVSDMFRERKIAGARGSVARPLFISSMMRIFFETVGAPDICVRTWEQLASTIEMRTDEAIARIIECAQIALNAREWFPIWGILRQWNDQLSELFGTDFARDDHDALESTIYRAQTHRNHLRAQVAQMARTQFQAQDDLAANYYMFCAQHCASLFDHSSQEIDHNCAQNVRNVPEDTPLDELRAHLTQYMALSIARVIAPHIAIAIDNISRKSLGLSPRANVEQLRANIARGSTFVHSWAQIEDLHSIVQLTPGRESKSSAIVIQERITRDIMIACDREAMHFGIYQGPLSRSRAISAHNFARVSAKCREVANIGATNTIPIIAPSQYILRDIDDKLYWVTEIHGLRAPFTLRTVQYALRTYSLRVPCARDIARECLLRHAFRLPGRGFTSGIYVLIGANQEAQVYHTDISHIPGASQASGELHRDVANYCAQEGATDAAQWRHIIREILAQIISEESRANDLIPLRAIEVGGYSPTTLRNL